MLIKTDVNHERYLLLLCALIAPSVSMSYVFDLFSCMSYTFVRCSRLLGFAEWRRPYKMLLIFYRTPNLANRRVALPKVCQRLSPIDPA